MTISYYAARANLYHLWQAHPDWSHDQFAAATGYSKGWVKKWLKRFRQEVRPQTPVEQVLRGHSRARKHPSPSTSELVVEQVLAIGEQPPRRLAPRAGSAHPSLLLRTRPGDAVPPTLPALLPHH
jgi:hypothetical protein